MSHNGAFDLPVVHAFTELPKRLFELKSAIADAPPMVLLWRREWCPVCRITLDDKRCPECGGPVEKTSIRYVDSLNIWQMPLDTLGESIGIPKLPMPARRASKLKWDTYCRQDVEVVRQATLAWLGFLKDQDLGGFAPTLASQAFTAFRHRFMPCKILIDANEEAAELARAAYLGGRVECFRLGSFEGQYYYLDVNSMYPAVMRDGIYPVRLMSVYHAPSFEMLKRWLKTRAVILECVIATDEPIYPVIHERRLTFPVGRFRATLAGPEVAHALAHGHLESLSRAAVYVAEPLFEGFVDFFYRERMKARRAGNQVEVFLYKILMNSLYGKFGQRGRVYTEVGTCDPELVEVVTVSNMDLGEDGYPKDWPLEDERRRTTAPQPKRRHIRRFGGLVQEWQEEGESRESFPAVSATVASYARLKLWEGMVLAGQENCLYCDTDSLLVTGEGFERLHDVLHAERLGAWKLERKLNCVTINGPKDYVFDGDTKVKGVRHSAEWLAHNRIRQDYFVGFKGLLRAGSLDAPIVYSIEKTLSRTYTKGTVDADGIVSPLRFDLR